MAQPSYDCRHCGACCVNPAENRSEGYRDYIQVDARAGLLRKPELVRRLVVLNADEEQHLRLVGDEQRCAALSGKLGSSVRCTIYADRPSPCRRVEAGSERCEIARRELGVTAR